MIPDKISSPKLTHHETVIHTMFRKKGYKIFLLSSLVACVFIIAITLRGTLELDESYVITQEKSSIQNMSFTLENATALAEMKINEQSSHKMAIKEFKNTADGWVFFYDSEQAVQTGDIQKYGVPGNVPLFVGRDGTSRFISNPNDLLLSK